MNRRLPERRIGRAVCGTLSQVERREWWLANGRGAYAGGTVAGTLTRRYHGLLVAPCPPPCERHLVAAKADATVSYQGREWHLFGNRWAGNLVEPAGHVNLESFRLDGRLPVWHYRLGGLLVCQRIWMEHGSNTTHVAFKILSGARGPVRLDIALLVNGRDHHGTTRAGSLNPSIREITDTRLSVHLPAGIVFYVKARGGHLQPEQSWYRDFLLIRERERGLPELEDHLCIAHAHLELGTADWCGMSLSTSGPPAAGLPRALAQANGKDVAVRDQAVRESPEIAGAPDWVHQLVLAADSFLIKRAMSESSHGDSVIAGYPWFGDWGRDTMIALPGLTLATGRPELARRILDTYACFVEGGMLPNVFPYGKNVPAYNSVDAALWYIEAWRAYVEATDERDGVAAVFPILTGIIEAYRDGTRYGIGVDPADGLLAAGEPGVQLTWMDAKVGDWVVTPRIGKPVEVNALWYNAVSVMESFARLLRRDPKPFRRLVDACRTGFQRFERKDGEGLYDVLDSPDGHDARIRPNQVLAVSLKHSALRRDTQASVVRTCRDHLLCSYGLRSLAPTHAEYRGQYAGGVVERDGSYHQGPVWAWLLGPYALAEFRVDGDVARAQALLEPFADHLSDAGMGHISEIFDGDPPHEPRGAPAQAWSVACILEAWWRLERQKREVKHA